MEKETRNKILTVIGVLVMVGGMFWGIQFVQGNNNAPTGEVVSGLTIFNGTIRTYEPFLVVNSQMPDTVLAELRSDERVKAVTAEQQGYLINVTTRDDVFPVAQSLREEGIDTNAVANIVLPVSIEVTFANGSKVNVTSPGTVGVWTEPLVDIDSDVTVRMIAILQGGQLASYSSPIILAQYASVPANATVSAILGRRYAFVIPWENRSAVDEAGLFAEYGNGSVAYERNDLITFQQPLSIAQMAQYRALGYVTYISEYSASVSPDFSDSNRTLSDFAGINVTLPDSMLVILSNDSVSMPFNYSEVFSYTVSLPREAGGYGLGINSAAFESETEYSLNDTVSVLINGTAIGNRIVQINGIQAY